MWAIGIGKRFDDKEIKSIIRYVVRMAETTIDELNKK